MRYEVKKQPRDSVPYGTDIATGRYVWCVYEEGVLKGVFATAKEARRKFSIWPQKTELDKARDRARYGAAAKISRADPLRSRSLVNLHKDFIFKLRLCCKI